MVFQRKQSLVVLLTLLCCCAAALTICGVWSTAFPRRESRHADVRSGGDDTGVRLSSSEIWTAGARALTSTDDAESGELQSSLPLLYHLPQIFALDYQEMTENLRVYIYPNSQTGTQNDSYEYIAANEADSGQGGDSTATGFFNLLASSRFLTRTPDEAHLFLLPVSIDALHGALGAAGVGNHLRHYVQTIRDSYKFWDRSLGADHFYLASHGFERVNHRNNLELAKNAVQVACAPLEPTQAFYPHKDIVIPHYSLTFPYSAARSTLAYVNLDLALSPLLPQAWESDPEFVMAQSEASPGFASSKFCISLSMRNVVDALRHGCVPVVVSDSVIYDLPFQDVLNWREFCVMVGTEEVADVKSVLTSMAPAKYATMQYLGLQASKHMEWNNPPAAYDAFHMTLFELWMRRYSVKYARRSEAS